MKHCKLFLLLCLFIATYPATAQSSKKADVNALADNYLVGYFRMFPENSTFYGIPNANNGGLSDNSIAGVKKWLAFEASLLAKLKLISKAELNRQDAITYGILHEQLEDDLGCRVCKLELWPANQISGWQASLSELADIQPVGSEITRNQTLQRWKQIPLYIQNEMHNMRLGLKLGYTVPQGNIKLVIEQLNEILKQQVSASFFYLPAKKDSTPAFRVALQTIIEKQIYPQMRTYRNFLTNEYLPKARKEISIAALPNGAACYKALLRSNTTLSITPEEVFNEGVRAIAVREEKMKAIGIQLYGTSDLKTIKSHLRKDSTNRFLSKEELIAFSNAAIERAKNKVPAYFGLIPKATLEIKPMPDYQRSDASHYNAAPDDGSRPATFYIQLYEFNLQDKGTAEVIAFHEGYPGHHLQTAIARELVRSHPIVKYIGNSGFAEGWARYTETLADEMGLYSSDRNRIMAYAGLPTGMVVDPGIHLKRWTREQAVAYTLDKQTSMTRKEAESYVDRIAIWPGQMTTYGVGESLFLQLKSRVKAVQGEQFNIKSFHDKCLELGTVPLNLLNQHVSDWLESNSARVAPTKQVSAKQ